MQALRVARPTDQLDVVAGFYVDAVGLRELSRFDDHDGFSGRILGRAGADWHLELVAATGHTYGGAPNSEHLLALYHDSHEEFAAAVARIEANGGVRTSHPNPWWNEHAVTFLDPDGYPVVLVPTPWSGSAADPGQQP